MDEAWRVVGVHDADINPAPVSHAEEKPQHSNDPWGAVRRRRRWCQRCGHWAVWGASMVGPNTPDLIRLASSLPTDMRIVAVQKRTMPTIDTFPKERNDQESKSACT